MKCANCGAELQVGSIYCSVCGKEAQIVSDYSVLEDDLLREMLNGEGESSLLNLGRGANKRAGGSQSANGQAGRSQNADRWAGGSQSASGQAGRNPNANRQGGRNQNADRQQGKNPKEISQPGKKTAQAGQAKGAKEAKKAKKKPIGWAVAAIVLMVFLLVDIIFMLNHSRNNSYDYQMSQAEKYYGRRDYEDAEECLLRAVELSDGDMEAELLLAKVYRLQGETGKAIDTLQKVIQFDSRSQEAYQQLIQVYESEKDYAAIYGLMEKTEDEDILQLFEEYQVEPPEFLQEEGVYEELISIEISSQPGCTVFYTMDGSDPKKGVEYQGPIPLEHESDVRIRAISRNEYGIYSEEAEGSFQVDLPKPDMPRVTPMGGSFYEPQAISVYVPSGCNVYYTWDGSVPSEASSHYMGPIDMPEGNNILSLILVDEYGRYSDVLKCNFIYYP